MSVLKSVLVAALATTYAVTASDATRKVPSKIHKNPRFAPQLPTIAEAEQLPKKPQLGPLSTACEAEVATFALPGPLTIQATQATSSDIGLTILGAAILYNDANKENSAPKFSIRTCSKTAYGPEEAYLKTIDKLGGMLKSCDCHDAPDSDSPRAPKLFHINCDNCSDLLGQQKADLFYRNSGLTCLAKFNAYHASKVDEALSQESKSQ